MPFINFTDKPLSEDQKRSLHFAVATVASLTGSRIFERATGFALQPHEEFKEDSGAAYFDDMIGENHFGLIRISDRVLEIAAATGSSPKYAASVSQENLASSNAFEQLLIHELGHSVDISYRDEYYRVDGKVPPSELDAEARISLDLFENIKAGTMPHDPEYGPEPQPLNELFDEQTIADAKPITTYGEQPTEALPEFLVSYVLDSETAEAVQKAILESFVRNTMRGQPRMGPAHIRIRQIYLSNRS